MSLFFHRSFVQRFDGVVQGGSRERGIGHELQPRAFHVEDFPPTDVCFRARLLRTDVGIELFVYGLVINAEVCAVVAVAVILHRPASVVRNVFKILGHDQLHAEAEHVGCLFPLVGHHLLVDLYGSPVVDGIGQVKLGRHAPHVVFRRHDDLSFFRFVF